MTLHLWIWLYWSLFYFFCWETSTGHSGPHSRLPLVVPHPDAAACLGHTGEWRYRSYCDRDADKVQTWHSFINSRTRFPFKCHPKLKYGQQLFKPAEENKKNKNTILVHFSFSFRSLAPEFLRAALQRGNKRCFSTHNRTVVPPQHRSFLVAADTVVKWHFQVEY